MTRHPFGGGPLRRGWRILSVDQLKATEKHACVAGPFGSSISSKYFVDAGVPVIRGGNLSDSLVPFIANGFVFVSEERSKAYEAQKVRADDLVFTCWGTIGQVGLIPRDGPFQEYVISNKQLKLRLNPEVADPRFVYFYFAGSDGVRYVRSFAKGAAVPGISLGILKGLEVALPSLDVQRRIAGVLSAYDDLIENNTRRIAILEEMARRLYEEWFVHFRFPGHETASFNQTSDDTLPEGWPLVRLDEVIDFDPRTRVATDGDIPFVPMTSLSTTSMTVGTVGRRCTATGSKFRNGDTLLARITPCLENGKTGYVDFLSTDDVAACGSTEFIVMRGRGVPPEFVQVLARSHPFRDHAIASMSGATGRQRVRREQLEGFEITRPPAALLERYGRIATAWFASVRNLARQSANLRNQRDLLLPKLVSGEIDLAAAEALAMAAE